MSALRSRARADKRLSRLSREFRAARARVLEEGGSAASRRGGRRVGARVVPPPALGRARARARRDAAIARTCLRVSAQRNVSQMGLGINPPRRRDLPWLPRASPPLRRARRARERPRRPRPRRAQPQRMIGTGASGAARLRACMERDKESATEVRENARRAAHDRPRSRVAPPSPCREPLGGSRTRPFPLTPSHFHSPPPPTRSFPRALSSASGLPPQSR